MGARRAPRRLPASRDLEAVKEVGGPSFFALLVIAVSFLPVLTLEAQEGRLFKPLAYTKNLAMIVAAVLAITLDPGAAAAVHAHAATSTSGRAGCAAAANAVLVGKIHSEERHPISRLLIRIYEPVCDWALRWKWSVIGAALAAGARRPCRSICSLGSEFMPPLDEGALLYMPSTMPGISIARGAEAAAGDRPDHHAVPRSERVWQGRAGRNGHRPGAALDAGDRDHPEAAVRSGGRCRRWYSGWAPEWLKPLFATSRPTTSPPDELVDEMNDGAAAARRYQRLDHADRGRIDMLTTGMRTPVGLKISGGDPQTIEEIGAQIEAVLPPVPGTRSVFAERTGGGYFLDIDWNRERAGALRPQHR